MNDKQRRFAREYVIDHNATQAATRAGYSAKSAHAQGHRLLKDAEIRDEIARLEADIANELGATKAFILQKLLDNVNACEPFQTVDSDGNPLIVGNPSAMNKALELLGKAQSLWVDRQEITHPEGIEVHLVGIDTEKL